MEDIQRLTETNSEKVKGILGILGGRCRIEWKLQKPGRESRQLTNVVTCTADDYRNLVLINRLSQSRNLTESRCELMLRSLSGLGGYTGSDARTAAPSRGPGSRSSVGYAKDN